MSAGGTQQVEVHTSCSKALNTGDIFGGLKLIGFNGQTFTCPGRHRRQYEAVPAAGCCYGIAKMSSGNHYSNFRDTTNELCPYSTTFPESNAPNNVVYTIFEQGQACAVVQATRVAASTMGCCYRFLLTSGQLTFSEHQRSSRGSCVEYTTGTKGQPFKGLRFAPETTCVALIHRQEIEHPTAATYEPYVPASCADRITEQNVCAPGTKAPAPPTPPPTPSRPPRQRPPRAWASLSARSTHP